MIITLIRLILFVLIVSCLTACAAAPRAVLKPVIDYNFEEITTHNVIKLSKVNITGDLKRRTDKLIPPIIAGFSKYNKSIKLVDDDNVTYFDGELILNIDTKSTLSKADYIKFVPFVSTYGQLFKSGIDFTWKADVNYIFNAVDGITIANGFIWLEGSDRYQPSMGAKRLSSNPIRTYLVQREKQRDGMDVKTYVAFVDQKKRLEEDREATKIQRLKDMDVSVKNKDIMTDVKSGTVMVLGIGVSKYQNPQIPNLKYADRDSQRIVDFFKNKYKLSDDRAILWTNEEATAIKITRFITNNAMKLLDKDDTFILYFGGHGAPDVDETSNDNDGLKKYLLLHDSDLNSLPVTALSLNNLATLLGKLPCKRVVILLDSCFAGTAGAQTLTKLKGVRISDKSYKNISQLSGDGRVIIAASNENQVSYEDDRLKAGVFTYYLLEGLIGKADSKGEGRISILELYDYIANNVSMYTEKKQIPVFRGSLDANIIF
jgi:hypothetical protein